MIKRAIRAYQRWQYSRTPRPAFIPTVTPVERAWTATDERLERDLYLASPTAFWLRPDRHEYKIPCWQIEGVWEAPLPHPMSNLYAAGMLNSGAAVCAQTAAARAQYAANMRAYSQLGLSQYMSSHSIYGGLANSLSRFL